MVHGDIPPPPGDIPRVITYEYGNTTIPRNLISFAAPVHSMHGSTHLKVRLTSAIFVAHVSGICWIAIDSQPKMKALAFGNLPSSDAWILKPRNCFVMLYSLYIYPVISLCILLKCKHIFLTSLSWIWIFFVGSKIVSTKNCFKISKFGSSKTIQNQQVWFFHFPKLKVTPQPKGLLGHKSSNSVLS